MEHLIEKLILENTKGLTIIKNNTFNLFGVNLGVLVISFGESVNIIVSNEHHDIIKDLVSTMENEDIFESPFISLLDSIVSKDNLLLSGPYILFKSKKLACLSKQHNYLIKKVVNDKEYLKKYSEFNNAVNLNYNKEFILYLLLDNNKVIAITSANKEENNIYSLGIEVKKDYRNQGIGTYLLKYTANDLINSNINGYYLVKVSNINSIKLAISAGLDLVGSMMFTV
ncbi:MAG: GNAT family N-acetyltransferase [Clostridia bacterium]